MTTFDAICFDQILSDGYDIFYDGYKVQSTFLYEKEQRFTIQCYGLRFSDGPIEVELFDFGMSLNYVDRIFSNNPFRIEKKEYQRRNTEIS